MENIQILAREIIDLNNQNVELFDTAKKKQSMFSFKKKSILKYMYISIKNSNEELEENKDNLDYLYDNYYKLLSIREMAFKCNAIFRKYIEE